MPRGEGFEPWIAVEKCMPFKINFKILNDNNQEIYNIDLSNKSKQLSRLGDLSYKNKNFCKFLIVQNDKEKWKLFKYGKKYIIKMHSIQFSKNTNIYLNLDYLSIWFPRSLSDSSS